MRIMMVAGEFSGDVIGAALIKELQRHFPQAIFEGIAGPKMREAGCHVLYHMEALNVMGFHQVFFKLLKIWRIRQKMIKHAHAEKPDLFIGIDYTDFNLSLAKALKALSIKTVQYKGPSVWAWRKGRIKRVAQSVDSLLTLFPFEQSSYEGSSVRAYFIGHHLADDVPMQYDKADAKKKLGLPVEATIIALMPGSRQQEVNKLASSFIKATTILNKRYSNLHFITSTVGDDPLLTKWTKNFQLSSNFDVYHAQSHQVLAAADVAVLASGTVTLEALLYKVPMVVAYQVPSIYAWLLKRLLSISYIALPNILAGRLIVPELLQKNMHAEAIADAVACYLNEPETVAELKSTFTEIHQVLRHDSMAKAAESITQLIRAV